MNKFRKFTVIVTMAVAFGGAGSVLAQDTTITGTEDRAAVLCAPLRDRAAATAEILGITVEELRTALAEGKTIRELAEELGVDWSEVERPYPECRPKGERLERTAEILGITVEELVAELESGKTIRELAAELGVELPDPRAEAKERIAEALGITVEELQAALDSGKTVRELAVELGVELRDLRPDRPGGRGVRGGRNG